MDCPITAYSTEIFPTLKTFCSIFGREKDEIKSVFQYQNCISFLDRLENIVCDYFYVKKLDCSRRQWIICAEKIRTLFLCNASDQEKERCSLLNERVIKKFDENEIQKYSVCSMQIDEYLENKSRCFDNQSSIQAILSSLLYEAHALEKVPELIQLCQKRLDDIIFSLTHSSLSELTGFMTARTLSNEAYSEAFNIFKKYPGVLFNEETKTVNFKILQFCGCNKFRTILDSLKRNNKFSKDMDLILKLAYVNLNLYESKITISIGGYNENLKEFTPFINQLNIEFEKLNTAPLFLCIDEIQEFIFNTSRIYYLYWKNFKFFQESLYSIGISRLGSNISNNGKEMIKFTKILGTNSTFPSYPESQLNFPKEGTKKFFDLMLDEFVKKQKIENHKFVDNNKEFFVKKLSNQTKKIGEKAISTQKEDINKEKNELQIKLEDKKLESISEPANIVKKAKKIVNYVDESVKALKIVTTKSSTYQKPPIITTEVIQLAMRPHHKSITIGQFFPGELFSFGKNERVKRWEAHDFNTPLTEKDFPEYVNLTSAEQKWAIIKHNPHLIVDHYLSFGFEHMWSSLEKNENHPCISIPTEITYLGQTFKGCMQFTFNTNKSHLYHKYFKYEFENDDPIKKKLNILEFPPISKPQQSIQYDSATVVVKDNGYVTIFDKKRDLVVKLFKVIEPKVVETRLTK